MSISPLASSNECDLCQSSVVWCLSNGSGQGSGQIIEGWQINRRDSSAAKGTRVVE